MNDDDEELLIRLRRGERAACSVFVRRHRPAISRFFAARLGGNTDHLVMATFEGLLQCPVVRGVGSSRALLYGLARSVLREHLRTQGDPTEQAS